MMENIDLKVLENPPVLDTKAKLIIEPLAPLSMVSDLPGSFYKSLQSPSKKMLCGLFENLLGWHIDIADRKLIYNDLIKVRQNGIKSKDEKKTIKQRIDGFQQGSTYMPLLMEYFEVEMVTIPPMMHYNDLWSKAYRRSDADVHPKGTINISFELIPQKRERRRDEKKPKQIATSELFDIYKNNLGKFPLFYTTPTSREYVELNYGIEINLILDKVLYKMMLKNIETSNCVYIGNSESWVNINLINHEK